MTRDEFQARTGASDAAMADLDAFLVRLNEGNAVMNLVGPDTLPDFWNRHAWDSAQLFHVKPDALTWADLGAGAGFPGVILAILLKGRPGAHVWLVESLAKRCRFLESIVDALGLPATVVNGRAEDQRLKVEVVTARAVAPLEKLLSYAQPYLVAGGQGLFLKGQRAEDELRDARKSWQIDAELLPSASDPRGRLVLVRRLSRVR